MADSTLRPRFKVLLSLCAWPSRVGSVAVMACLAVGIFIQPACGIGSLQEGRALRLACLGDSITDGFEMPDKARHAYVIAATLGERLAERNITFINRGIGGDRVADLQMRWQSDVFDLKPDVLSVLVGINDTFWSRGETVEQFERIYVKTMNQLTP